MTERRSPPAAPPPPPRLFAKMAKWALVVAGFGLLIGAAEGAALGLLLREHDPSQPWVSLLALDRALALGAAGFVLGTVSGAIDWAFKVRRARRAAAK